MGSPSADDCVPYSTQSLVNGVVVTLSSWQHMRWNHLMVPSLQIKFLHQLICCLHVASINSAIALSSLKSQPFMSCNTHEPLLISFQPVPDPSNHFHHLHVTSEIPRTKCQC